MTQLSLLLARKLSVYLAPEFKISEQQGKRAELRVNIRSCSSGRRAGDVPCEFKLLEPGTVMTEFWVLSDSHPLPLHS